MKNLTLRQRILASFLVILAIMTLMVVVDYRRLLHIEAEAMTIRDDAVPGLYYSTEIRSAWFGGFVALQDAFRADTEQERRTLLDTLPKSDQALDANVEHYRRTMSRADDIKMFESFEKALQEYSASAATSWALPGRSTRRALRPGSRPSCAPPSIPDAN